MTASLVMCTDVPPPSGPATRSRRLSPSATRGSVTCSYPGAMPVLDGWSVLEQLREDERTRAIPCIAFTAFTALEDRRRALEAGFAGYLGKPYVSADLFGMIERLLAGD